MSLLILVALRFVRLVMMPRDSSRQLFERVFLPYNLIVFVRVVHFSIKLKKVFCVISLSLNSTVFLV